MSGLKIAKFEGTFQRRAIVAVWTRESSGDWTLELRIDGDWRELIEIAARQRVRAAWATTCDYLRAVTGAPQTMTRSRPAVTEAGVDQFKGPRLASGTDGETVKAKQRAAIRKGRRK